MARQTERQQLIFLTGMLVCACLVLKPLLLLGHLLTDDHCWRIDVTDCSESFEQELVHLGLAPHEHEHEHGAHAHEPHCHDSEDEANHHSHCPLSLEEHLAKLTGEPADVRGKAVKRLVFLQIGLVLSPTAFQVSTEWRHRWDGTELALRGRGADVPLCPRGPPVA